GSADAAGWSGTGPPPGRLFALRPRSAGEGGRPPGACVRGLPVSPSHLLQHVDVEGEVGDDLLEPRVLLPEGLQLHDVGGAHGVVLGLPPVVGLDGDLQASHHLGELGALLKQRFCLTQLADDLLGGVPLPLHESHLLPPWGGRDSHSTWTRLRGPSYFVTTPTARSTTWSRWAGRIPACRSQGSPRSPGWPWRSSSSS